MKQLTMAALLLVIALVSVSAHLRLEKSGIGCADWPACYGLIGAVEAELPSLAGTYDRLATDASEPLSWATPVHRLVASVLGLVVLAITLICWQRKRDRLISVSLLSLTVFLAWLGIYSLGLHSPAVVMANLTGGFSMLGLLGWMTLRDAKPRDNAPPGVQRWVVAALVLLGGQVVLGGLTSANFGASACQTLPDCHGSYLPGADLATAFDLSRIHEPGPSGLAPGGPERADIHKLHRLGAAVTSLFVLIAAGLAFRAKLRFAAVLILTIVTAEFAVGLAAILSDIPIAIAVAHNWLAAMLLLALLRLLALCKNQQALH